MPGQHADQRRPLTGKPAGRLGRWLGWLVGLGQLDRAQDRKRQQDEQK